MFILTLDVWAQTASFRIPEQHTFQPTLPLPPITTLIGLMGAALGLTFDELADHLELEDDVIVARLNLFGLELSDSPRMAF